MGEVYRAIDTKLDREVALKVLPPAFLQDPERLARFEREAKLLAQLHHPNIASIFGLEESGGIRALVMELVEGPTLAERLEPGPFPFPESLAVALQIAQALEEAHEIYGDRPDLVLCKRSDEALEGADALAIVTEWREFRSPDFELIRKKLRNPAIFDGRNLYDPAALQHTGIHYFGIGRGESVA